MYSKFDNKIDTIYSYTNIRKDNLKFSNGKEVLIPRVGEDPDDYNHCAWLSLKNVAIGEMISVYNTDNNPLFTAMMFNAKLKYEFAKKVEGGTVTNLYYEKIKNIYVSFPVDIKEQQKIADFLTLIDKRIETQMKIIEEYKSLIKGIREKVFNNYKGKIIKLHEVLSEYTEKNTNNDLIPIAVGKYGIRLRSEIYTKELSEDLSKNKVVTKNTLIIGMGTKQIDIGILLDDITYCVSPAYTTYKINNIDAFYLNELLIHINPLLSNKYMITSARQGKSVNKKDLLKHTILIHHNNEQYKIAALFKHLCKFLRINELLLKNFQDEKIYFLNNLFI